MVRHGVHQQYKRELLHCKRQFEQILLQQEQGYLAKFTTFSATISHLLPAIARYQHEPLFHQALLNQVFTGFDQAFLGAGDVVQLQGDHQAAIVPGQARIFCTYHLGSYRLLTSVLFRRGVDCVLLVGSQMHRTQGAKLMAHIEALRQQRDLKNSFSLVEVGSPSAVMVVLRALKAGKSLIVYVDGSPETAPQPGEADKFATLQFGPCEVLARKGVGYLSYLSKVAVVPVISYRQPDLLNVMEFLPDMTPDNTPDRDTYCQTVMQRLYDVFWPYLNRYPSQWEGWNYLHGFLKLPASQLSGNRRVPQCPVFNQERYTLCDFADSPVLFDRQSFETYEISPDLRDLLTDLAGQPLVAELVGDALFGELVEKEILC